MKIVIFIISLCFVSCSLLAHTLRVGKHETYNKIQDAIHAAKNGDSILVEAGIYREKNLLIDKPVFLAGIGHPVLDGEHQFEIISVKADSVTIRGFKLVHSGVSRIKILRVSRSMQKTIS